MKIYIDENIFINPEIILEDIDIDKDMEDKEKRKKFLNRISNKLLKSKFDIEGFIVSERRKI